MFPRNVAKYRHHFGEDPPPGILVALPESPASPIADVVVEANFSKS
jgi:hypothetical protein